MIRKKMVEEMDMMVLLMHQLRYLGLGHQWRWRELVAMVVNMVKEEQRKKLWCKKKRKMLLHLTITELVAEKALHIPSP